MKKIAKKTPKKQAKKRTAVRKANLTPTPTGAEIKFGVKIDTLVLTHEQCREWAMALEDCARGEPIAKFLGI